MSNFSIEDLPLGGLRETDVLHAKTHDGTCSRCRESIAEEEMPLLLWTKDGENMYAFCTRCAWDPDSDRCRVCGCTSQGCSQGSRWRAPGLCSNCPPEGEDGSTE